MGVDSRAVPNLADPWVRQMADDSHLPEESWVRGDDGEIRGVVVACRACGQSWMCATRAALIQLAEDQRRRYPLSGLRPG